MLPRVAIFAMGGTIAMAERGEHGVKPSLGADALVEAVPQLAEVASIEAETFRLLPSPEVTIPDLFALADAIEQAVADGARGVVVTHGTDTMEESAFVLDRILALDAPVVLTGAMRNPTLAGPDGPANLLNSVRLAVHAPARGLGVMVVMNDEIHAARYVQKGVTSNPAAFSLDAGRAARLVRGGRGAPRGPARSATHHRGGARCRGRAGGATHGDARRRWPVDRARAGRRLPGDRDGVHRRRPRRSLGRRQARRGGPARARGHGVPHRGGRDAAPEPTTSRARRSTCWRAG